MSKLSKVFFNKVKAKAVAGILAFSLLLTAMPVQAVVADSGASADEAISVAVADRDAITEFVTRLYQNFLVREPDPTGLDNWVNLLVSNQTTGSNVVKGFVHSREFRGLDLNNTAYITALYNVIFGRDPDRGGMAAWTKVLDDGYTKDKVLEGFLNSEEMVILCTSMGILPGSFKSTEPRDTSHKITEFVVRLYANCLGRKFDDTGLTNWVNALAAGTINGYSAAMGFFTSREMRNMNLTDEAFVILCYRTLLGREPDPTGKRTWLDLLQEGTKQREEVVLGFCKSVEFDKLCSDSGLEVFASALEPELLGWLGKNLNQFKNQYGWMEEYEVDGDRGFTDYRVLAAANAASGNSIEYIALLSSSQFTIGGISYGMDYQTAFDILDSKYYYFDSSVIDGNDYESFAVSEDTAIMFHFENGKVRNVLCAKYE